MKKKVVKIRTVYGKILTVDITNETDEYISGHDKFGSFVKVLIDEIASCEPCKGADDSGVSNEN